MLFDMCISMYYLTDMPTINVMAGIRLAIALVNVADVSAILLKYRFFSNDPLQYHMFLLFTNNQYI